MASIQSAYAYGKKVGSDIALNNSSLFNKLGYQKFRSECEDTESDHFRQFSPFEFTAAEFNRSKNRERIWGAYEKGVSDGIKSVADALMKQRREQRTASKRR